MTSHPDVDMISFTGSTGVGRLTMSSAAQTLKKVSLELGGKNPQIVFPDADIDAFIDAAVFGAYFNAGECCNAGSRLILHKSIAEDVVKRVADLAKSVKVGDPSIQQRRSAPSSRLSTSTRSTHTSPAQRRAAPRSPSAARRSISAWASTWLQPSYRV